jgi:hypothetical protein
MITSKGAGRIAMVAESTDGLNLSKGTCETSRTFRYKTREHLKDRMTLKQAVRIEMVETCVVA